MSIPIHILIPQPTQPLIQRIPKAAAKPLDTNYVFRSVEELEDYIKNSAAAFVGQAVLVGSDVYIITETGENPEYHKLQNKIKLDK